MDPSKEICRSLVKWLQEIVPQHTSNIVEICDGVGMMNALLDIAPDYFCKLEPKIKKDVGGNWRLKTSNLKKIVEAVIEFYQDNLNTQLLEVARPDVNKIAENSDPIQLAKLLRLILGCAVYCERKKQYITKIMEMEESVQRSIMLAIEQLEDLTGGSGRSGLSLLILDTDTRVVRLVAELDAANEAKGALAQQCQQLEQQILTLMEEKQTLLEQNEDLKTKEALIEQGARFSDSRNRIELLKEELYKMEVIRDDYKAKIIEQEKQMTGYLEKIAELQIAANASARLKDEVDALTESAGKVADLELALASYKKRLENHQDIRNNLKKLEEENMEYLQKNLELKEEITRNNIWRTQSESYRAQLTEIQQKLDEETQKSDIAHFKIEKLEAKIATLQGEKERLIIERDSLRDENEELRFGQSKNEVSTAVSQELTPTEMKEHLRYLEKENKTLRSTNQDLEAKQAQLETALNRIENLLQQNRTANQNILKLEAQLEEMKTQNDAQSSPNNSVKEYKQKIVALQEALTAKDNEIQSIQLKYGRSVDKVRDMSVNFDPKNIDPSARLSHMKDLEERMMAAAFYKLGSTCQREAMDDRIAILSGQGNSFLARQRQSTSRKQIQPKLKSK